MIELDLIKDQDLQNLDKKKVILHATWGNPIRIYKTLKYFKIDILGYFTENLKLSKPRILFNHLNKCSYISYDKLQVLLRNEKNIVIQKTTFGNNSSTKKEKELRALGVLYSTINSEKIVSSFFYLFEIKKLKNPLKHWLFYSLWKLKRQQKYLFSRSWFLFQKKNHQSPIIVCSPPKTGDFSINDTLCKSFECRTDLLPQKKNITHYNLWHNPCLVNRVSCEKHFGTLKVVVGLREPITQNLSALYQRISTGAEISNLMYKELYSGIENDKKELIYKYGNLFGENKNDVQPYWNIWESLYVNEKTSPKNDIDHYGYIQWFIPLFEKYILDITAYPFDTEKGYSIIKEGNTEVFVYQIEKLNYLAPEFSTWIGVPFDQIENSNKATGKWIAESYKQAQKEIEITQEYFDKCFDEPYVKHCYSEADIEKFKAKWRTHIR